MTFHVEIIHTYTYIELKKFQWISCVSYNMGGVPFSSLLMIKKCKH